MRGATNLIFLLLIATVVSGLLSAIKINTTTKTIIKAEQLQDKLELNNKKVNERLKRYLDDSRA